MSNQRPSKKVLAGLRPQIILAHDWGARPPKRSFPSRPAKGIMIHHTAGPNATPLTPEAKERKRVAELAKAIQLHHMDKKGWSDSGHHFLVTRGGIILEGRTGTAYQADQGKVISGAHSGDSDPSDGISANTECWGIEVEGNYDRPGGEPTAEQWAALVELCGWLVTTGMTQSASIWGHQTFTATACPGRLMLRLPELREAARAIKLLAMGAATGGGSGSGPSATGGK